MYPSIFNDGGVTRAGLETSSVEQLSFFVGLGGDNLLHPYLCSPRTSP